MGGAQSAYLGVGLPAYGLGLTASPGSPVGLLGYKAEAGGEGGAVHEVPGILPSAAVLKQVSTDGGAVQTTGVAPAVHGIWKREAEAEADPAVLVGGLGLGYGLGYG